MEKPYTDVSDRDKKVALLKHLDLKITKTNLESVEDFKYDSDLFKIEGENKEYLVLTDYEADKREKEYVINVIEECYLSEYYAEEKRTGRSNVLLQYVDIDKWVEDWCGNRGENISHYNGVEYYETVKGVEFYIYRTN